MADRPHYDVITVSDLRLPGGTAASIAEELTAQDAAGLRSGVVHIASHLVARERPFNPRIRAHVDNGTVDVIVGSAQVSCDLLVLRHPAVLLDVDPARAARITAERVVVVANQSPGTPEGEIVHYDPRTVVSAVRRWVGGEPTWLPIGPLVRANLGLVAPELRLAEDDWVNIIDVDRWVTDRSDRPRRPLVIGRHSRDHVTKWPSDAATMRAAYPDAPDIEIQVLGGATVARDVLGGRLPGNWTVYGFGERDPERFLSGIDVLVYYHHPDWVEAFGRTVLEALASGAVAVLPEDFRDLFGEACLYAEPAQIEDVVRALGRDPKRYRELSERGVRLARERFGHEAHIARLANWLGRSELRRQPPEPVEEHAPRVLFVSSNGAGVGHLMRLMSMARRAEAIEPVFLTLSQAIDVVHQQGYPVEYLPSRQYLGGAAPPWHQLLRSRLARMVDEHDIEAVVFDGTWPYEGLLDLPAERPGVQLVWSRRAMWKPGITSPGLDEVDRFALVLEPGEYATDADAGVTRQLRHQATRVAPITFLDRSEQLDRAAARRELGLDPDQPAALVQLGAGNINDTSSLLGLVVARLAKEPGLQICVTRSAIASAAADMPDDVRQISVYPLARYLAAFDLAIAASGYNTYHELVATPVPTLFVPNLETSTDDQLARARHAERMGVGRCLTEVSAQALDAALTPLLDIEQRTRMRERAEARLPDNGAGAAIAAIEALVAPQQVSRAAADVSAGRDAAEPDDGGLDASGDSTARSVAVPKRKRDAQAGTAAKSGGVRIVAVDVKRRLARVASARSVRKLGGAPFRALPRPMQAAVRRRLRRWDRAPRPAGTRLRVPEGPLRLQEGEALATVLFRVDRSIDDAAFRALVHDVAGFQTAYRGFAPLFVTHSRDVGVLRGYGFAFEYLPDAGTWPGTAESHRRYLADRMADIASRFKPHLVVDLRAGDDLRDTIVAALRALV